MKILIDEEVVKQALDALVKYQTRQSMDDLESAGYAGDDAITALRSALQAERVKPPIAWSNREGTLFCGNNVKHHFPHYVIPLYAAPTPPTNTDSNKHTICLCPDCVKPQTPFGWYNPDNGECGEGVVDYADTGCLPLYTYTPNTDELREAARAVVETWGKNCDVDIAEPIDRLRNAL